MTFLKCKHSPQPPKTRKNKKDRERQRDGEKEAFSKFTMMKMLLYPDSSTSNNRLIYSIYIHLKKQNNLLSLGLCDIIFLPPSTFWAFLYIHINVYVFIYIFTYILYFYISVYKCIKVGSCSILSTNIV